MPPPRWWEALQPRAPDVVAAWLVATTRLRPLRRELRARAGPGTAAAILRQQEAVADALSEALDAASEEQLRAPGGEEDWNVAQAFAHTTAARRWLVHAAALSCPRRVAATSSRWCGPASRARPTHPGSCCARYLDKSRRSMAQSAEAIAGHEAERCPLDHPLVGHLRCGEWLLFAGVHDLMHLQQLHRLLDDG